MNNLSLHLIGWGVYTAFALFALFFIFPDRMVEATRLFLVLGTVFLIGGMDYFVSRLSQF